MNPQNIALFSFAIVSAIILLFAIIVLWKIYKNQIDISGILLEAPSPSAPAGTMPKASLSRFQFLIFTFVVAGLFLLLSIESGSFVDIPNNVLGLLGISGGSYLISKAAQK